MKKRLPILLVLVAGAGFAYWYANRPPASLVLTGVVTTNDVVVSPQIAGRIRDLLVSDGETVKRDQLIATIAPDELRAESAFYTYSAEGLSSQVRESEAALRYQELQTADQVRQAESNLAATQAQVDAASA